jgi:hypothetical protein
MPQDLELAARRALITKIAARKPTTAEEALELLLSIINQQQLDAEGPINFDPKDEVEYEGFMSRPRRWELPDVIDRPEEPVRLPNGEYHVVEGEWVWVVGANGTVKVHPKRS